MTFLRWLFVWVWCVPFAAQADVLVFAAASMKPMLDRLDMQKEGEKIRISYAASSTLARQIIAGAPADIFISANQDWMAALAKAVPILEERVIASNRLVVAARRETGIPQDWTALIGPARLAVAQVRAVPAGIYAKEALQSVQLWDQLQPYLAQTDHVRAAQVLLERGEVPLAILYASDVHGHDGLITIKTFAPEDHRKIEYPVALLSAKPEARAFFARLVSPEGHRALKDAGFLPARQGD